MLARMLTVGFAVGAVLHLLLLALAQRTSRRIDRLFLWLFGSLFLWHAGNLLALTLASFQGEHRAILVTLARALAFSGLALLPPLLAGVHIEYAAEAGALRYPALRRYGWLFFLPLLFAPLGVRAAAKATGVPSGPWTAGFIVYFALTLAVAAWINLRLAQRASRHFRVLHGALATTFAALAAACIYTFLLARPEPNLELVEYLLMLSSIVPSGVVGYWVFRFNFFDPGVQRMVAVAMLAAGGLLVYAAGISRLSAALERAGYLPSLVTEALFIFCMVALVDPVTRRVRVWMTRWVSVELSRLEALRDTLLNEAVRTQPAALCRLAAERIGAFFGFPVEVSEQGEVTPHAGRLLQLREAGSVRVLASYTAEALERCRLVAERIRLERELAEREKLAALGEMTAFIAHRIKNPLSAISTLAQLIGEQAPETAEHCAVIRGEIRRLSTAVSDLLRYTAPESPTDGHEPDMAEAELRKGVRGAGRARESVDAAGALQEAAALFSHEAENKQVRIECQVETGVSLPIAADRLHDLLTSLLGNAVEAAPPGSRITVSCGFRAATGARPGGREGAVRSDRQCLELAVEDEGPGVAAEHREKIFNPFFTLKPGGTGLGLALAQRRVREAGAEIRCISPASHGRGARFEVTFGIESFNH